MGVLQVGLVEGTPPPYNIVVREISEVSGNRCVGCTGISDLSSLNVNYIDDGLPHTYLVTVSNASCTSAVGQFVLTCSCVNTPTLSGSFFCDEEEGVTEITLTPNITGGGPLRVILQQGSTTIFDAPINSGTSTVISVPLSNLTYEAYSEVIGSPGCRSNILQLVTNCGSICTLEIQVLNPSC